MIAFQVVVGMIAWLGAAGLWWLELRPARASARVAAALGAVALGELVLLGGVWPSLLTPLALLSLPALVIALAAVVRPRILERQRVRRYCLVCVSAFGLLWVGAACFEAGQLLMGSG